MSPLCNRATLVLLLDIPSVRCRFRIIKRVISRFLSEIEKVSDAKQHPPIRITNFPSFVKYLKSIVCKAISTVCQCIKRLRFKQTGSSVNFFSKKGGVKMSLCEQFTAYVTTMLQTHTPEALDYKN